MLKDEGCLIYSDNVKSDIIGFFVGVGFCLLCAGFMYIWMECFVKDIKKKNWKHDLLPRDSIIPNGDIEDGGATNRPLIDSGSHTMLLNGKNVQINP